MIISHKHKFIFIKCHKVASTSMEIALSSICGPNDIITEIDKKDKEKAIEYGFIGPQNIHEKYINYRLKDWLRLVLLGKRKKRFAPHMSAIEVRTRIPERIWNSYFKFAFDRNPWDKVISTYYYADGDKTWGSFENFINSGDAYYSSDFKLYSYQGRLLLDKVYKLEELQVALSDISNKLKLKSPLQMPVYRANARTRTDKRHYTKYYNNELKEAIELIFAREIKLHGYQFQEYS